MPTKRHHRRSKFRQALKYIGLVLAGLMIVIILVSFEVIWRFNRDHAKQPYLIGVTFSVKYAEDLGVNWQDNLNALINDLHVRHFRLMSYWDVGEPQPGQYDFKDLDWQIQQIDKVGGKVSLAVGLRQPRYPECFAPDWAQKLPEAQRNQALESYIAVVVDHYKHDPAIVSWQLENEALNTVFGACKQYGFSRQRLQDEVNVIHSHDRSHPVVLSVSNEFGVPLGHPRPDVTAFSIYRRVWDATVTHNYFNYPFPAWYFKLKAGVIEQWLHEPVFIHELQAEPWGKVDTRQLTLEDQNQTLNATRLLNNVNYAKATGIREMYLWGGEYWYWRMLHYHDASVWNQARQIFATSD